mmetsp:Transcript_30083/g.71603  ORF Transcript_30083/g.71603 Transcript_30083/m.71603 type:complete len:215 (+) Transcript_30083:3323-3967(+)
MGILIPHRRVKAVALLGKVVGKQPPVGRVPPLRIDDSQLPAAPRALHVVAAEADAARGEVLRAEVVVHRKLLRVFRPLHRQDSLGCRLRVSQGMAPTGERRPKEGLEGLPMHRQGIRRHEEDLRVAKSHAWKGNALERYDFRWRAQLVPQSQGLGDIISLCRIDTSRPELAELLGSGHVQDVGSRKNPLQQVNGIRVCRNAQSMPVGILMKSAS